MHVVACIIIGWRAAFLLLLHFRAMNSVCARKSTEILKAIAKARWEWILKRKTEPYAVGMHPNNLLTFNLMMLEQGQLQKGHNVRTIQGLLVVSALSITEEIVWVIDETTYDELLRRGSITVQDDPPAGLDA